MSDIVAEFVTSISEIKFVRDENELIHLVPKLSAQDAVGIDLESNSMYRYHHHICLMQLATQDEVFIVDTTTTGIPPEFIEFLLDQSIVKIFQDMQYDVALFFHHYQIVPSNLFDISQADRLIRENDQLRSLDKMALDYLGIEYPDITGAQKTNWGERPLTKDQIIYAANDVSPLIKIYEKQKEIISQDYRYDCFRKYMDNQTPSELNKQFNPLSMWKIRGMEGESQYTRRNIYHLLIARDEVADYLDRPFFWVARDHDLLRIARNPPNSVEEMEKQLSKNSADWLAKSAARFLFNALEDAREDKAQYDPPEPGVSLKRWVDPEPNDTETGYNPYIIGLIKDWGNIVSEKIRVPRDYLYDKSEIAPLSVQNPTNIVKNVSLRGIPEKLQQHFRDDLFLYLEQTETKIDSDMLNSLNGE